MSSLWTPDGEYPVGPKSDTPSEPTAAHPQPAGQQQSPTSGTNQMGPDDQPQLNEEQLREAEAYMQALTKTPARVVVVNHVVSIFQLAQIHLASDPPKLEEARLAIDSAAAIVEGVGDRLGPEGKELKDATAQLRMAFVQIQAAFSKQGNGTAPTGGEQSAPGAADGTGEAHPGEPRH